MNVEVVKKNNALTDAVRAIKLAGQHVNNGAVMATSAQSSLDDARKTALRAVSAGATSERGELYRCAHRRAVESLGYSVGCFHAAHIEARHVTLIDTHDGVSR